MVLDLALRVKADPRREISEFFAINQVSRQPGN